MLDMYTGFATPCGRHVSLFYFPSTHFTKLSSAFGVHFLLKKDYIRNGTGNCPVMFPLVLLYLIMYMRNSIIYNGQNVD